MAGRSVSAVVLNYSSSQYSSCVASNFHSFFQAEEEQFQGMKSWRCASGDAQENHKMNSRGGRRTAKYLRPANVDWYSYRICFRHSILLLYVLITHHDISTQKPVYIASTRTWLRLAAILRLTVLVCSLGSQNFFKPWPGCSKAGWTNPGFLNRRLNFLTSG